MADEQQFTDATFAQILASDAKVIRPNGAAVAGLASIVESHAHSFARFEATQHLLTAPEVEVSAERATLRANLVAIHLWKNRPAATGLLDRSFNAGGVVILTRTQGGWRIAELRHRVLWRAGHCGDMVQTS